MLTKYCTERVREHNCSVGKVVDNWSCFQDSSSFYGEAGSSGPVGDSSALVAGGDTTGWVIF